VLDDYDRVLHSRRLPFAVRGKRECDHLLTMLLNVIVDDLHVCDDDQSTELSVVKSRE
jgi:hypothetical protein